MDIKREKLNNAILFFAKKMYLTKTKLMKSLYELDFRHFRETGKSVTGLKYYAWDKGPVPLEIFHKIKKDRSVTEDLTKYIKVIARQKGIKIIPKTEPNLKVFTKRTKGLNTEIDYLLSIDETALISIEEARQNQTELKETEDFFHALCS